MLITIRALLFGRHLAKKLISKNKGKVMLFTYEGIGDLCLELAYCNEFKKIHNINHLAILTTNDRHPIFRYFRNEYDSVIKISQKDYLTLLKFYKSDLGQVFRRKHEELKCVFYTAYVRSDMLTYNRYVSLSDIEKKIYRLPPETMPHAISDIDNEAWLKECAEQYHLVKGKSVLMNPYANSVEGVPFSFFELIVSEIKKEGFTVVTGIHGDQKPLNGTEGISFGLDKAVSLANYCGYIVGIRSGFLDLCAFSRARIVAVDHDSYWLSDATKLEKWWPQNKSLKTYTYSSKEKELVSDIVKYVKEGKI